MSTLSLRFALRDFTLKTKLLLVMLALLLLSLSTLFVLHLYRQQQLLAQVRDYTGELSTALEIASQELPPTTADSTTQGAVDTYVQGYADKLTKLGVKDVKVWIVGEEGDTPVVRGSTDPRIVGQKPNIKRSRKGPQEYVIKGVLGEEGDTPASQKTSSFTIPIVVGDKRVGSIVIKRYLDDFSELSHQSLMKQLAATLGVFAFGIVLALYLSWTFSRPLQELSEAASKVAAGDLQVQVPTVGKDEIGRLARTFNEMVVRLRENRQLEERLHFAERSTSLGRLASAMAHEIRNPLNFINLSIDHVRERLHPEEAERRQAFDRILGSMKAEISRLNRLVGDFLSFGKPMRLDPRPSSVGQIVTDTAALVEHKAKDQGITLSVEVQPDLPPVVVDPELLKTCILNLMINACDAMPRGGRLSARVQRTDGSLVVTVHDTGHGMSAEQIRAAFEPYFSTKEAGLGLGLALTHKIVTDHGGTIALESVLEEGTTATVRLPVAADPASRESVA
jgi:signal transduction histidine kinase